MSGFKRFELIEHSPFVPSFFEEETSLFPTKSLCLNPHPCFPSFPIEDELDFTLGLLTNPISKPLLDFPSPFHGFDTITDLIHVEKTPFYTSTRRVQHRSDRLGLRTELYLQSLCDRLSALELSFDRLAAKEKKSKSKIGERKYTWTAEIKDPQEDGIDKKYKWTAEIKDGKKKGHLEKNYKYTAEIKGKGEDSPISRKYTFTASTGDAGESSKSLEKEVKKDKDKKKSEKKSVGSTRLIEIQEQPSDHGTIVLRQVRPSVNVNELKIILKI